MEGNNRKDKLWLLFDYIFWVSELAMLRTGWRFLISASGITYILTRIIDLLHPSDDD